MLSKCLKRRLWKGQPIPKGVMAHRLRNAALGTRALLEGVEGSERGGRLWGLNPRLVPCLLNCSAVFFLLLCLPCCDGPDPTATLTQKKPIFPFGKKNKWGEEHPFPPWKCNHEWGLTLTLFLAGVESVAGITWNLAGFSVFKDLQKRPRYLRCGDLSTAPPRLCPLFTTGRLSAQDVCHL